MHSGDLTAEQAGKIYERLRPMFSYLAELQKRMEERKFHGDDKLYLEVQAARYSLQLLCKDLHRMACGPSYPGYKAGS